MLSDRLKKLIDDKQVSHAEFALAAGMNLERVRSLLHDKAKKLKVEEIRALKANYNVHDLWLTTGKGPMWIAPEERKAEAEQDGISFATQAVVELGLTGAPAREMHQLLYAWHRKSGSEVLAALESIRRSGNVHGAISGVRDIDAWASQRPDEAFLQQVFEITLEEIERQGGNLPTKKFAALLVAVYDASLAGNKVDPSKVAQLVKLAS